MGAHRDLTALAAHPEKLSPAQLREVKDDLCVTDFTIGRPSFSLAEQRRVCAEAAEQPGSQSAAILSRIDSSIEQSDDDRVEAAIASDDLAAAEAAIEDYEELPDADEAQVRRWSSRLWRMVEQREARAPSRKTVLNGAVAALKRENPDARRMSEAAFKRWVIETATFDGNSMAHAPHLEHGRLKLDLPQPALASAALNLDRLAQINDAVVARCGCDAKTEVGLGANDLPAYVVRLDPEIRHSEVLILLSGARIGSRASLR